MKYFYIILVLSVFSLKADIINKTFSSISKSKEDACKNALLHLRQEAIEEAGVLIESKMLIHKKTNNNQYQYDASSKLTQASSKIVKVYDKQEKVIYLPKTYQFKCTIKANLEVLDKPKVKIKKNTSISKNNIKMIEILRNDKIYKKGKVVFKVRRGDKLIILKKKICRNNKPCYKVKKEDNNKIGYMNIKKVKLNHKLLLN